ncbi:MAG TPA: hypothetical protein VN969_45235 [Streptosporangiaceae bacterium]|nr:hypothetical protein [Streptosporangiaceae bacterium]
MISSIQYLPCRTVSTDLSASAVSTSSTSSLLTEPPAQTAVAASSVAPPEKPEKRRHSACSASSSRSQLQSTTARSVWCLGSAVRLPPVSSRKRSSSRVATCSGSIVRIRAAASSMASGIPSSARQIRSAAGAVSVVRAKPGLTAQALCSSSDVAGLSASGPTGASASPVMFSGSRLVARMRTWGHALRTFSARMAAAVIRCSQLSRTISVRFAVSALISRPSGPVPRGAMLPRYSTVCSLSPSAPRTAYRRQRPIACLSSRVPAEPRSGR